MGQMSLFHFDENRPSFEDLSRPNGGAFWMEDDLREAMEYHDESTFRKVVMKGMQACLSLSISTEDNFVRLEDGSLR